MLSNSLQYAGQHPQQRIICPQNLNSAKADKSWPKEKGYHLHLMQGIIHFLHKNPLKKIHLCQLCFKGYQKSCLIEF